MNKIKFTYPYNKLINCYGSDILDGRECVLIQALHTHYNELSEKFILFDTTYIHKARDSGIKTSRTYSLPRGELILLLFDSLNNGLFTTLRYWTKRKWDYYRTREGQLFKIEMRE